MAEVNSYARGCGRECDNATDSSAHPESSRGSHQDLHTSTLSQWPVSNSYQRRAGNEPVLP